MSPVIQEFNDESDVRILQRESDGVVQCNTCKLASSVSVEFKGEDVKDRLGIHLEAHRLMEHKVPDGILEQIDA